MQDYTMMQQMISSKVRAKTRQKKEHEGSQEAPSLQRKILEAVPGGLFH
jgi:hypothetical protein